MKESSDDQEDKSRVPSQERVREEPEQTWLEQRRRAEAAGAGRVLQEEGQVRIILPQRTRVLMDEETNDHRQEPWPPAE